MRMNRSELEEIFIKEAASFQGKVAYLYADLDQKKTHFSHRAADQVVSASMIKVPIMMAVLERLLQEQKTIEEQILVKKEIICEDTKVFEYGERTASIKELLTWMIINSDNTSTNVLIQYMGMDRLQLYFNQIGLETTKVERLMLDFEAVAKGRNNYLSVADFYQCMRMLDGEEILTPEYCQLAIWILKQNRDDDTLNRYLFESPKLAHKTGGLDHIEHDAGIFYELHHKYFLGVFVSEFEPVPKQAIEAQKLIGRLSRLVYDVEREIR